MRKSRQRELIIDIITGNTSHPTAEAVYQKARETDPTISLGTVYRNLRLLAEEKKILTLETEDKSLHYDYNTAPHAHFICEKCGRILDIFDEDGDTGRLLKEKGFTVKSAKRIYYGECGDCAKKKKLRGQALEKEI